MRKLIFFLCLCFPLSAAYNYQYLITLGNSGQIPASQTNFTVLVCANGSSPCNGSVTGLNQSGGGARVLNASGFDIVFSSTVCSAPTLMSWEMELYTAATGEMYAWVLVPSLAASGTFYMCVGNPAISTFQGGATGSAWDANYKIIYHMATPAASVADSTSNANTGTPTNISAATGQIDGGGTPASGYVTSASNALNPNTSDFTASLWVKPSSLVTSILITQLDGAGTGNPWLTEIITTGALRTTIDGSNHSFTSTLTNATWAWLVLTKTGSTINLYKNGTVDATTVTATPQSATGTHRYGASKLAANFFAGTMDDFRLSNVVRSANWITTEWNNQNAPASFLTIAAGTAIAAVKHRVAQ